MSEVKFVELPEGTGAYRDRYRYFWDALRNNPGQWAQWPGNQRGGYTAVTQHSRNGEKFEGRLVAGVFYIRAVAS